MADQGRTNPDEILRLCNLLAPAGEDTTTRLNGADIWPVVKAARAYAEMVATKEAGDIDATAKIIEVSRFVNDEKMIALRFNTRPTDLELLVLSASPPAPAVAQDGVTDEGADYLPNRLRNYAEICESRGLLIEASGMRDIAKIIAPLLAENAGLKEEAAGACFEYARAEGAEADANRLAEALRPLVGNLTVAADDFNLATTALAEYDKATKRDESASG